MKKNKQKASKKRRCPHCGKKVFSRGMVSHFRMAHSVIEPKAERKLRGWMGHEIDF